MISRPGHPARPAIPIAAVLLLAGAWIAAVVGEAGGAATAAAVSNVGQAVAALTAAAACWWAAWRRPRVRRVWACLGGFAFSWGAGQVVWTWYENVLGREVPFPSLADVGFLAAVPLAAAGLLLLPTAARSLAARVLTLLDGLIIAASCALVSWVLVLEGLLRESGADPLTDAIGLAYPIGDVVLISIVLYAVLQPGRGTVSLGLIGAGLLSFAIADSGFVYMTSTEAYSTGALIDAGWFLGFVAILVAALRRPAAVQEAAGERGLERSTGMVLPYTAVGIALVSSVFELIQTGSTDPFVWWTRTVIIAAIVVRQVLTLLENGSLYRRLQARLTQLHASEQRFQALVQHSSDVVTVVDRAGVVVYQSESVQRVFGYEPDSLVGRPLTSVLVESSAGDLLGALAASAREPEGMRLLELEVRHAAGRSCSAEMTITNLLDNPSVGGLVLNTRDVSERKRLEDQLVHDAFHDALTALANRNLFRERVDQVLRRRDGRTKMTALFLDLDGFKEVNDSLGHASGDVLLVQVAERLRSCVRHCDTVARLGGDEFAILLEDDLELDGVAVAERITRMLRDPFKVDGNELHVSASIGIADLDDDVEDADQLLRNADLAMYRAKAAGEGGFERYHPNMHQGLVDRLQLEAELRRAIAGDELVLHYQPTLVLSSGELCGVEALVRWEHPTRGLISPGEFIPLAEQTGLIRPLGRWVLHEACKQLAEWRERYPDQDLVMSVNVSAKHLQHSRLLHDVRDALDASGVPARALLLEMTESVLMAHTAENLALLARLKEMGIRIAIDDFGTGYSSLAYLHRFPADVIKIDRSFIDRIGGSSHDIELVKTIVRLGQSLSMITVAEGVEEPGQAHALRSMGCELAQGYHFSRPVPPAQLEQQLGELVQRAA
jgi:diguanylate cyclase (GGDEF)-like protein/PAS domain S-box-containing protein